MKAKFLIGAAALMITATSGFASTPSSDPFGALSNDQTSQPAPVPQMGDREGYLSPFGDHLQRGRSGDDMRPMDSRMRNDQPLRGMDASGVPDPRI